MTDKTRTSPYTIEHFGDDGWHVVDEAQRMETAMLRARAIFRQNPQCKLRLVARLQEGRRRAWDLKPPKISHTAAMLVRERGPDTYTEVAEKADRIVLAASLCILSMAVFNAWPLALKLGGF